MQVDAVPNATPLVCQHDHPKWRKSCGFLVLNDTVLVFMYECLWVWINVWICACMYVLACLYLCMYAYIYAFIHTWYMCAHHMGILHMRSPSLNRYIRVEFFHSYLWGIQPTVQETIQYFKAVIYNTPVPACMIPHIWDLHLYGKYFIRTFDANVYVMYKSMNVLTQFQ